jgi:hypothetical protein
MLIKEANLVTGGLSDPSKMRYKSFNLNARDCITGSKLVKIPNSVCATCYALKGNYVRYSNVAIAQARRLKCLHNPNWVEAMATLTAKIPYFRYFDSGDIQSLSMLIKIAAIAMINKQTKYWLPTKEYKIVSDYKKQGIVPNNLVIRVSAPMKNQRLNSRFGHTSMVIDKGTKVDDDVFVCDASHTMKDGTKVKTITKENKPLLDHCGDCTACWNPNQKIIAYPIH